MNILLWVVQVVVAIYCIMGSLWRFSNYDAVAKGLASIQAFSPAVWNVIGVFEIVCALGLLLPGVFKTQINLVAIAATGIAVEMLLLTGWHFHFYGFEFRATNPTLWTLGLAIAAAFIAYGRFVLRPL